VYFGTDYPNTMPAKRRKAQRGGKGSKKKGGDVTACSPSGTPAALRIDALKARIAQLRAQETKLTERIDRDSREHAEVREAVAEAEAELDVEVLAPVANGVDPTEWLPEELLMAILIQVVTEGICGLVCRRWYAACQDGRVTRRAWEGRWEGYSAGWRVPQKLVGHTDEVTALAVGPDGTVYSASLDATVRAWSGTDGSHLRDLDGPALRVYSLAVGGPNGAVYGGTTGTIRVWSGTDGSCQGTLEGDPDETVEKLAVTEDGTVFAADTDYSIQVWSDREQLRTLIGHTDCISALVIGTQGRLYSGSFDTTIRVWSVANGTHLSTLEGHTDMVDTVVVGLDGTVYSGSSDTTIRVWSADDGRLLRTLLGHTDMAVSVAVDSAGTIFSRSADDTMRVWCGATGTCRHVLTVPVGDLPPLVIGQDSKLYTLDMGDMAITVW
jgi:WD40 repeat protein